jgi:hypothetical protein
MRQRWFWASLSKRHSPASKRTRDLGLHLVPAYDAAPRSWRACACTPLRLNHEQRHTMSKVSSTASMHTTSQTGVSRAKSNAALISFQRNAPVTYSARMARTGIACLLQLGAFVAMSSALAATATGCAVSNDDLKRWEGTERGPDKLYAVLTHAKYSDDVRKEAAMALIRMPSRNGQRVGIKVLNATARSPQFRIRSGRRSSI